MRVLLAGLAAALLALCATAPAGAQGIAPDAPVTVCPAAPEDRAPPDFTDPACETVLAQDLDPQGRMIWARARLPVSEAAMAGRTPLGVFVFAKASSEVYLNGARLGANGVPGASRAAETPGRMDAVFPAPREALHVGDNDLVLRLSAQRGLVRLSYPIHAVLLAPYETPQSLQMRERWPSLITFGALLAGGLYFAATAVRGEARRSSALLALMSLAAAGQLFMEVSRALYAYPYPFHEIRVVAILALSATFGLLLAAHILWTFEAPRRRALLLGIAAAMAVGIFISPGFDQKSALAIFIPTCACALGAGFWTWRRRPRAASHLAALLALAVLIALAPSSFLDLTLFYALAAFLLFLFVQQAFALADAQRLSRLEAERASRLELILEQARRHERPEPIKVTSAGRIELVPTDQIVYFKGAGDYVEIRLADGRDILHNGSLGELETSLPATFLRVHRSHIVNTAHVRSLKRDPSGVGRLVFADGTEAPVSRRIMPKVRAALE